MGRRLKPYPGAPGLFRYLQAMHKGSSGILVATLGHHLEFATVEEDAEAVVVEASKSSGG